jgi:tetratricopeptide (TPR) repeat protein
MVAATLWNRTAATRFMPTASLEEFGLFQRLAQGFYTWAAYLWKTCWPVNLSPSYTELLDFQWWGPRFLCSFLLVTGITCLFVRQRGRWPAALPLWMAYLALLFPMLGLTEHPHYVYDRYSFLVGVLCAAPVAWFVLHVWPKVRARAVVFGSASAALVVLGGLSLRQTEIWNNAQTFLPYLISQLGEHPVRAKQDLVYGVILMRDERFAEAEKSFRNAIQFNPTIRDAHTYLGDVLADQQKLSEAIMAYHRALELNANDLRARQGLAVAFAGLKRFDEAVAEFKQVLLLDAKNVNALHNLAVTLGQMGQKELAMDYYRQAQEIRGSTDRASR